MAASSIRSETGMKRALKKALPWAKTIAVSVEDSNRPRIQCMAYSEKYERNYPGGKEWPRAMFGVRATGDTFDEALENAKAAAKALRAAR